MKQTGNEATVQSRSVTWAQNKSFEQEAQVDASVNLKGTQPSEELDIMMLASKRVNTLSLSGARQERSHQHENISVKTIRSAHSLTSSLTARTDNGSTWCKGARMRGRVQDSNTWRKDACAHSKGNHYVLSKIVDYMQTHTLASYFKNPSKEDRRKNSCLSDVTKSLMAASVLHVGGRFNRQADSYLRGFRRGLSYATDRLDQLIHDRGENPERVLLKRKLRPTDSDGQRPCVKKLRRLYFLNEPHTRPRGHAIARRKRKERQPSSHEIETQRKAAHRIGTGRQPRHESRVERQPRRESRVHSLVQRKNRERRKHRCESSVKTQPLCESGVKSKSRGRVERQPQRKSRVHKRARHEGKAARQARCESSTTTQPLCESGVKRPHRSESRGRAERQTRHKSKVHRLSRCESGLKIQPSCESGVVVQPSGAELCSLQELRLLKSLQRLRSARIRPHQELFKTKPGVSRVKLEELTTHRK